MESYEILPKETVGRVRAVLILVLSNGDIKKEDDEEDDDKQDDDKEDDDKEDDDKEDN